MNSRTVVHLSSRARRREDPRALLMRLSHDVEAARVALARGRETAITHTARGLMSSLGSGRVQVELAYAASAFAEGRELRDDAEQWVFFAVSARALLEHMVKSGAASLAPELEQLDASLEDARDAVLLLAPEEYKEALAGTPPNVRAWWGERARLDAAVREIDLERALGLFAE
jgi:hypothetical protein